MRPTHLMPPMPQTHPMHPTHPTHPAFPPPRALRRAAARPSSERAMPLDRHTGRAHNGGFIIVAVLWIMLALATLASIYAAYVVRTAYAVGPSDDRVNAEALFTAAIELTAYQLTAAPKEKRPSH